MCNMTCCKKLCSVSLNQMKSYIKVFHLEGKCGFGERGSPKLDIMFPFDSLDICSQFGGVLVMVLGFWVEG